MRPFRSKLYRAVPALAIVLAALGVSTTQADAKSHHGHGHGAHRHACAVRRAYIPPSYVAPVYVVSRPAYVVARPAYVVAPPAYVVAPVPYDRPRDGVAGFIGISGPHVSIGIGF